MKNLSLYQDKIPDESIDVIITDPPYGSNVQYLELSHFWYVWNKDLYYKKPSYEMEAVANRKKGFKGAKTMHDYEQNLYKVFCDCYRVLKKEKYMALTFNSRDMGAWLALLFAIFRSGFTINVDDIYFQSGVKNYKQTSHSKYAGSAFGDYIYIFKKSKVVPNKIYESEKEFSFDLEETMAKYLQESDSNVDKYILVSNMLKEMIPSVENFSKTYLNDNEHYLFKKFNKTYLKTIY